MDNDELNELLEDCRENERFRVKRAGQPRAMEEPSEVLGLNPNTNYCQWSTSDDKRFLPTSKTVDKLVPGVYDICMHPNIGLYFEKVPVLTIGLINLPETNVDKVVAEIKNFWKKEKIFKEYNLTYKRGLILWGPPGGGKTSVLQFVMRDVVERGGVVFKFCHPSIFLDGIRKFREIQPNTPVVILMEDIDAILEVHNESEVLNILDGVDQINKAVFLATTNYPEKLGARIINRPSRFDKRFKIGYPNAESRKIYFEFIIGKDKIKSFNIDLKKWVKDTEGFSIAHLKELFVAVIILGDNYEEAIETLSTMKEAIKSSDDEHKNKIGFAIKSTAYREKI